MHYAFKRCDASIAAKTYCQVFFLYSLHTVFFLTEGILSINIHRKKVLYANGILFKYGISRETLCVPQTFEECHSYEAYFNHFKTDELSERAAVCYICALYMRSLYALYICAPYMRSIYALYKCALST